jgi:small subunit ribosomal protein S16
MLTIRLQRRGKKKDPSFRVIVVESKRGPKTGNYLEMVGSYDARVDRVDLKPERIKHWLAEGATLSDTVHNLLISQKIIEGKKINVLPKKTVPKVEASEVKEEKVEVQEPSLETAPETVSLQGGDAPAVTSEVAPEKPVATIAE